jgi:DNA-directed RNA polymerase subunit RPC12/RpoP
MEKTVATKKVFKEYYCSNPECTKKFEKPKLIQYYACPHCMGKVEEIEREACQYFFSYLSKKDTNNPIPEDCVECKKVLECMLNQEYSSQAAVEEIKKWY